MRVTKKGDEQPVTASRHFLPSLLVVTPFLAVCAGCLAMPLYTQSSASPGDSNRLSYEHQFTDAAADAVRKSAETQCPQRNRALVAVRTSHVCSIKTCTTQYTCMDKADAPAFRPDDRKK